MKKAFFFSLTVIIILFSGCVKEKEDLTGETAESSEQGESSMEEAGFEETQFTVETDDAQDGKEQAGEEADEETVPPVFEEAGGGSSSVSETQQELEELEDLLGGLDSGEFGDIDYSE